MLISDRGMVAIIAWEGVVPGPYLDVARIWTFGAGHTARAGAPDPAKMTRGMPADLDAMVALALDLFRRDVARYAEQVSWALKVPVSQTEFDALVSFHYNTGAISHADLTVALNRGDRVAAAKAFLGWLRPVSVTERRRAEQALFAKGVYPMRRLPVWSVALDGRVIWRPVRMLSGADALAIMRRTAPPVPSLPPVVFSQPAMPMPVLPATPKPIPATAMPMPATRKPIPPLAKPIPAAPASGFFFLLAALVAALKGLFNGK